LRNKTRDTSFLKKIEPKIFVEFLTFDSWNALGGTKNDVYRRLSLISSIYRVKKVEFKCAPFPLHHSCERFHPPASLEIRQTDNEL